MNILIDILREFGLPIAFLFICIVAIYSMWKKLCNKDKEYIKKVDDDTKEFHELYNTLDRRSRQFADTIKNFIDLFGHGGHDDS